MFSQTFYFVIRCKITVSLRIFNTKFDNLRQTAYIKIQIMSTLLKILCTDCDIKMTEYTKKNP